MSEYKHREIELKWQTYWLKNKTNKTTIRNEQEKYYVLDMFPYPSGEGLHVGHPLGYIASDIYSRYKKHQGFNVLHPMGYDSFGLPAEQYAIQTGQHPAITTKNNISRYKNQLQRIGFSYDWDREIRTSNPEYYIWTQWIFKQIFNSWYNKKTDKAEEIEKLIEIFKQEGNKNIDAECDEVPLFTSKEWKSWGEEFKQKILMNYRLTYLAESWVNWCPELGTVLANDEVKDGISERGGHLVEQKLMKQWSMRISAYADRLLKGLEQIDFSESLKEQQRNWIGKSTGASIFFQIVNHINKIEVFTTRPDTIFGTSFITLAPEHELVDQITTNEYRKEVIKYKQKSASKTERERQSNSNKISGQFTGAYAIHPFTKEKIEIWIGEYVLYGYGTGAVMAVPAGDQRDYEFAKYFKLPIPNIFKDIDVSKQAFTETNGQLINSHFLDGLSIQKAIKKTIFELETKGIGKGKINYRIRDAIFSRQRYWGEPFPVYYINEIPYLIEENQVITLPKIDKYLPTKEGKPPLARAKNEAWDLYKGDRMEFNTMPGWAGSSWYFLRYMDPHNKKEFVSREKSDYWSQVDLYVGGAEHAVGHLLYSRFWTKFLYDRNFISFDEPFKKLINQGMIGGEVEFILLKKTKTNNQHHFISFDLADGNLENYARIPVHIDFIKEYGTKESYLDKEGIINFRNWRPNYKQAIFETKDGIINSSFDNNNDVKFITKTEHGKMSKRHFNTIDPVTICDQYGADTLRCYEMFLGPLEDHKPWNINGITGVNNFLKKTWKLFHFKKGEFHVVVEKPSSKELKILHKAIKKITDDLDRFSFNTIVSNFMIVVNELSEIKCNNKEILSKLLILISPYVPHVAEELWQKLGNKQSITFEKWPSYNSAYLIENEYEYPISFNGKMRFKINLSLNLSKEEIEKVVLEHEKTTFYLKGDKPKKVIVVLGRIVNIVV